MKLALLLLSMIVLASTASATADIPSDLNSTDNLLRYGDICKIAGNSQSVGIMVSGLYDVGEVGYSQYYKTITEANDAIRNYNIMMRNLFNDTESSKRILEEFRL